MVRRSRSATKLATVPPRQLKKSAAAISTPAAVASSPAHAVIIRIHQPEQQHHRRREQRPKNQPAPLAPLLKQNALRDGESLIQEFGNYRQIRMWGGELAPAKRMEPLKVQSLV